MGSITRGISRAISSVGRAISSVGRGIGRAVSSVFGSSVGKALLLGTAIFFGAPMVAGAMGGAGASAGATAWWKSTFGLGQAAGQTAGQGIASMMGGGTTTLGTVTSPTAAIGSTVGSGLGAAPAAPLGITGGTLPSGFSSAVAGGVTPAATQATGLLSGMTNTVQNAAGAVGEWWGGLGDFSKGTIYNMAGQAVSNYAQIRAEEKRLEEQRREEKKRRDAQSIFMVRHGDGESPEESASSIMRRVLRPDPDEQYNNPLDPTGMHKSLYG